MFKNFVKKSSLLLLAVLALCISIRFDTFAVYECKCKRVSCKQAVKEEPNWVDFGYMIDGVHLQWYSSVEDFEDAGFVKTHNRNYIKGNDYFFMSIPDTTWGSVFIVNREDTTQHYSDCDFCQIDITSFNVSKDDLCDIELAQGIGWNSTKAEVIEAFGEPVRDIFNMLDYSYENRDRKYSLTLYFHKDTDKLAHITCSSNPIK